MQIPLPYYLTISLQLLSKAICNYATIERWVNQHKFSFVFLLIYGLLKSIDSLTFQMINNTYNDYSDLLPGLIYLDPVFSFIMARKMSILPWLLFSFLLSSRIAGPACPVNKSPPYLDVQA